MKTWIVYRGDGKGDDACLTIAAETQTEAAQIALVYGVTGQPEEVPGCYWFVDTPRLLFSAPKDFALRNTAISAAQAAAAASQQTPRPDSPQ